MARKPRTRARANIILPAILIFAPVIAWIAYAVAEGQHPFQLQPPPGAHQPTR